LSTFLIYINRINQSSPGINRYTGSLCEFQLVYLTTLLFQSFKSPFCLDYYILSSWGYRFSHKKFYRIGLKTNVSNDK